jgi:hypothetical protein
MFAYRQVAATPFFYAKAAQAFLASFQGRGQEKQKVGGLYQTATAPRFCSTTDSMETFRLPFPTPIRLMSTPPPDSCGGGSYSASSPPNGPYAASVAASLPVAGKGREAAPSRTDGSRSSTAARRVPLRSAARLRGSNTGGRSVARAVVCTSPLRRHRCAWGVAASPGMQAALGGISRVRMLKACRDQQASLAFFRRVLD